MEERKWYQKLLTTRTEYYDALDKGKVETKVQKILKEWEEISYGALLEANKYMFKEVLSWHYLIAPGIQSDYAEILKSKAVTNHDKLLATLLVGGATHEIIALSDNLETSLLAEITEKVVSEENFYKPIHTNILTVINNRPDILFNFGSHTFDKFSIEDDDDFLKNKKLYLLLNCFTNSIDYESFSNKIKSDKYFFQEFSNNAIIAQNWNRLSDFELDSATNFQSAITVFNNASKNWKENLNNFKNVLKLMDHENFELFLKLIEDDFGPKSFYADAARVAKDNLTMKQLKSGAPDFQKIHLQASEANLKISKIRKKIIQKFLEY